MHIYQRIFWPISQGYKMWEKIFFKDLYTFLITIIRVYQDHIDWDADLKNLKKLTIIKLNEYRIYKL